MTTRQNATLASRRQPQQTRSTELVDAILQAALQVLAREGAARFTTTRVAERAGTSVGSLYQYFPNKAALLFRLQREEWGRTTGLLRGILEDVHRPPLERLRAAVHAFLRSECEEAAVRIALHDAAPLYRHAPEVRAAQGAGTRMIRAFLREVLPEAPDATRALAGDLITTTLNAVGKQFSAKPRGAAEIAACADAVAEMFCAYLRQIRQTANRRSAGH